MVNGELEEASGHPKKEKQLNSIKASGQDWFYHAPKTDKNEKPNKALPVSQIPGIGDLDTSPVDIYNDIHMRRKWIRETDSKYVKLAKEGGRKDLFIYREHKPSEKGVVHYPRVDWFDHYANKMEERTNDQHNSPKTTYKSAFPEWYVHEAATFTQEAINPSKEKRQIIAFDDMSYWKREAAEEEERRIKSTPVRFPSLAKKKKSKPKQEITGQKIDNYTKFPNIVSKPKEEATIGQLLSMKYHQDWLDEQTEKRLARVNKKEVDTWEEKHKAERDQVHSKRTTKDTKSQHNEEKALFKLARFANVPAKTDSHRV